MDGGIMSGEITNDEAREVIDLLHGCEDDLTLWDLDFIICNESRENFSRKQLDQIARMEEKYLL